MWQCHSVTEPPPTTCQSIDCAIHIKHIERGKKQMAGTKQSLLTVKSAAFPVISLINDSLSQGMAAVPITTALVADIR